MNITIRQGVLAQENTAMITVGVYENEPLDDILVPLLETDDFKGKLKQDSLLYPRTALPARRALLIGMGKRSDATVNTLRHAAAHASRKAKDLKLADYTIALPFPADVSIESCVQAIVEGTRLGHYSFLEYKSSLSDEELHTVENVTILLDEQSNVDEARQGVFYGQAITEGVILARNLANAPGNTLTPAQLGDIAQEVGTQHGLKVRVLAGEDLVDFGGLLAVGKGSVQTPRFIIVEYGTASDDIPTICLVGKGITFDTGGISIKPSDKMDDMKMDMSGAAAVLGTMRVLADIQPPLHVVCLISAAENMPDAAAYKPGDIIKTLSGKTVEVLNTDAEGRIVLADALHYAQQYNPQAIVDVATLTGAIVIALGPHATGVMGNNQPLIDRLLKAGTITHERVWQLPLWQEHKELMKSTFADIKNISGRPASSTTAAAFLSEFVGTCAWAHLDIAGTAWTDKPPFDYISKGATGVGVRLLTHMLRDWNTKEK